jgi:NAD(P)H-hydrate epimerase
MQKVLTAEQMREVDRLTTEKYGIPSILLMENAAHAVARVITEKLGGSVKGKRVLVLCGKGNNGGDGAALGRVLGQIGAVGTVLLFGKVRQTKGDARINFQSLRKHRSGYPFELIECEAGRFEETFHSTYFDGVWRPYDVIVDAIFGTGLSRPLSNEFAYVVDILSEKQKWKQRWGEYLLVSVDIPSGLNADSAEPIGANVHADVTVTFTAPKLANVMSPAAAHNGELFVEEIGSWGLLGQIRSNTFVTHPDPIRGFLYATRVRQNSYKKKRGTVSIVAGSRKYPGAAVLAANSSFMAGAGMVKLAVPDEIHRIVAAKTIDEVIVSTFDDVDPGVLQVDAVAVGCGLASNADTHARVIKIVDQRRSPLVIDAEGLNTLSPFNLKGSKSLPLILTPHIGEFERLVGRAINPDDRIEVAREFSKVHKVILVLKGERIIIGDGSGRIFINPTGNAGVSRAGAGDTLTGIITSFIAQYAVAPRSEFDKGETAHERALTAVLAACYVAGISGDIAARKFGQRFMTASDIRECIADAICEIDARERVVA